MSKKHPVHPHLEMCLCPRCASHFYASPCRFIRPMSKVWQPLLNPCDLCRMRKGRDFRISLPS